MAKEYPASKTQLSKAAELGISTSDAPGYTTLGSRLEAAGWSKDGKTQMDAGASTPATDHLESLAGRQTYRQWAKEQGKARFAPREYVEQEDADRADQELIAAQRGTSSHVAGDTDIREG